MLETWKPIPRFPDYEASTHGQIRRAKPDRRGLNCGLVISQTVDSSGRKRVALSRDGKKKSSLASRLICEAFHGPPPSPAHQTAHGDGDPLNNRPNNLRWATQAENQADRILHGTSNRGERHGMAKLTSDQVGEIRSAKGSQTAIAAMYDVHQVTVSRIKRGTTRRFG